MLGWILFGLAAAAVGVVVISEIVSKKRIKEKMRENGIKDAIIMEINKCSNTVKLESLYGEETLEIRGDDLDDELEEDDVIYA